MPQSKEPINPFYVVLVLVGVLFIVTASAFTLLLVAQNRTTSSLLLSSGNPLLKLLRDHGMLVLCVEVTVLGVASVCAMWLDNFRDNRAARSHAKRAEKTEKRA